MPSSLSSERGFRGHIAELDGLRAYGSMIVLLNHFWPKSLSIAIWHLGQMGWIAMDSFFVLSGFLITGILIDSRNKPDYYRTYYRRRALRIFPLYYVVLALLIFQIRFRHGGVEYKYLIAHWGSPAWFLFYLGNIKTAIANSWTHVLGFSPLWSLQIEEQFYLLFPFAVRWLRLENLRRLLLAAVCISPIVRVLFYLWHPGNPFLQYVLLPSRFDGLALGGLIAIRYRMGPWKIPKITLPVVGVVLLGIACAGSVLSTPTRLDEAWSSPFNRLAGYSISSAGCACLILWLIQNRGAAYTAWLRLAPVQYVGKISYGIYLLHLIALGTINGLGKHFSFLAAPGLPRFFALIFLSIGYASVSWYLLERPLLRLKDCVSRPRGVPEPVAEATLA
jgi:peptidoglycan/LPS O-acetylase OafA/YrhL